MKNQSVDAFRHKTGRGRDRILNCNQCIIRECPGGNKLSTIRSDQCGSVGVGRTIAVGLDDFSKGTSCCRRDIHDLSRGRELNSKLESNGTYTAEPGNGLTMRVDKK